MGDDMGKLSKPAEIESGIAGYNAILTDGSPAEVVGGLDPSRLPLGVSG